MIDLLALTASVASMVPAGIGGPDDVKAGTAFCHSLSTQEPSSAARVIEIRKAQGWAPDGELKARIDHKPFLIRNFKRGPIRTTVTQNIKGSVTKCSFQIKLPSAELENARVASETVNLKVAMLRRVDENLYYLGNGETLLFDAKPLVESDLVLLMGQFTKTPPLKPF